MSAESREWQIVAAYLRLDRAGAADKAALFAEEQAAEDTGCTDDGQTCRVCGDPVTWLDHLPPREPGGFVRCYAGAVEFMPANVYPLRTRGGH